VLAALSSTIVAYAVYLTLVIMDAESMTPTGRGLAVSFTFLFGMLVAPFALLLAGALTILLGVPVHNALARRRIYSFGAYASAGLLAGALVFVGFAIILPFANFNDPSAKTFFALVGGGATAATVFWLTDPVLRQHRRKK